MSINARVPIFLFTVVEFAQRRNSCIIDQDIDSSVCVDSCLDDEMSLNN